MSFHAMVPVFAVPSRAWSTYFRDFSRPCTRPTFAGLMVRITLPSGPTIALATRGS